jgi:carboxymethylenebutenolidase
MGQETEISAVDSGRFAGYLALPRTVPTPGLIVLPEVYNTNTYIRSAADDYADDGFVVIAPDIYWRQKSDRYLPYVMSLPLSMPLSRTSFTARGKAPGLA